MPAPSRRALAVGALAFFAAAGSSRHARAGCDSARCHIAPAGPDDLRPGRVRVELTFRHIDHSRLVGPDAEPDGVFLPRVDFESRRLTRGHHLEQAMSQQIAQLDVSLGLSRRVAVTASVPLHSKEHETIYPPLRVLNVNRGIGDVQLGARWLVAEPAGSAVHLGAAVKVPTGDNRRLDAFGFIDRPEAQPGTGSTDVLATVHATRRAGAAVVFANVGGRWNGESGLGYRFGPETTANAGITRNVRGPLAASLQLGLRRHGRDAYLGRDVPSTGGAALSVIPGLRVRAPGGATVSAFLKLPLVQRANEAQLAPRYDLVLGVARSF